MKFAKKNYKKIFIFQNFGMLYDKFWIVPKQKTKRTGIFRYHRLVSSFVSVHDGENVRVRAAEAD